MSSNPRSNRLGLVALNDFADLSGSQPKEGEMAQAETQPQAHPVALAVELRPLLERNAVRVERDRRLPIENVEALLAANLFKVMTPRRWGG